MTITSSINTNLDINTAVDVLVRRADVVCNTILFERTFVFQSDRGILIAEPHRVANTPEADDDLVFLHQARIATSIIDSWMKHVLTCAYYIRVNRYDKEADLAQLADFDWCHNNRKGN